MSYTAPASTAPLADWLAYIEGIHPVGIELGLERVRAVAERLQLLQNGKLNCPVITVAGTNGKGSTCATLEGIYAAAGYKTGLYTSPHLVHFEERCRIHGQSVAAADLAAAFARVEAARLAARAHHPVLQGDFLRCVGAHLGRDALATSRDRARASRARPAPTAGRG